MRKIAFQNQRGGSGKTTSCINIAHALALMGRKVLLMDIDGQGTVKTVLGGHHDLTTYDFLFRDFKLKEVIVPDVRENMSVIFSDKLLFQGERAMVLMTAREQHLRTKLAELEKSWNFDYILLDCPPALSEMVNAAYFYANEIIIPVSMDYVSLSASQTVLETLRILKTHFQLNLQVTGILPVGFNPRLTISDLITESLASTIAPHFNVFPPIRQDTSVAKAMSRGKTLFDYYKKSLDKLTVDDRAAWDYFQVARLLDSRTEFPPGSSEFLTD